MPAVPHLETARLTLDVPSLADFDDFAGYLQDPIVMRYIAAATVSREEAWTKLLRQVGLWKLLGFGFFVLRRKADGQFVGVAGFQDLRRDLSPSIEGSLEAGWVLRHEFHGQGYASEAMQAALAWAAATHPALDYSCIIDPDNAASLRLADRLGFREEVRTDYQGSPVILLRKPRAAPPEA